MDDVIFSLSIGRSTLLGIGLVLLFMTGAGIVMAFFLRRRMMSMMRGGGCPCMAMLRGGDHTRD